MIFYLFFYINAVGLDHGLQLLLGLELVCDDHDLDRKKELVNW